MLSRGQKTGLRLLLLVVAVAWIIVGITTGWPTWAVIVLAVLSAATPSLIAFIMTERLLRRHRKFGPQLEHTIVDPPPGPPEPPQPHEYSVQEVPLPSARPEYHFAFSCTVFWRLHAPISHANPGALAAEEILKEAASFAAMVLPDDASRAQHGLARLLGVARMAASGYVEVWADRISLCLTDKDAGRLKRLAELRKDEEVWESVRRYERNVRAYLGDDVLTSPGSALVWWLAGPRTDEKDRVEEAVNKIEKLRTLTAAAAATEIPDMAYLAMKGNGFRRDGLTDEGLAFGESDSDPFTGQQLPLAMTAQASERLGDNSEASRPQTWVDHVVAVVDGLPDGPQRAMFADRFADLLRANKRDDAADHVRRRFNAPDSGAATTDEHDDADDSVPFSDAARTPRNQQSEWPDGAGLAQSIESTEASTTSQVPGHPVDLPVDESPVGERLDDDAYPAASTESVE